MDPVWTEGGWVRSRSTPSSLTFSVKGCLFVSPSPYPPPTTHTHLFCTWGKGEISDDQTHTQAAGETMTRRMGGG